MKFPPPEENAWVALLYEVIAEETVKRVTADMEAEAAAIEAARKQAA